MDDKKAQFFPFHIINEYMMPDYRLKVLQAVFSGIDSLPKDRRSTINNMVKRYVQVPGFRNSPQAPSGVKARASVAVFERRPEFVAQLLQAWTELHPELRDKVYAFLQAQSWEVLPADADRSKLPGFLTEWPKGQDYDVLGQGFKTMFPDFAHEENDLRLMIVWLADRLPFDEDDAEEAETETETE